MTALLYGAVCTCTSAADGNVAHIALLLPLSSGPYVAAAEAVRDGFLAAADVQGHSVLPLRIYAASGDPQVAVSGYRQAVAGGARVVVGPLTRDAVSALAATRLVPVPTLALNAPEGAGTLPPQLYALSLQVEMEAQAIARVAFADGRRRAYTVAGNDPLSKRMNEAFVDTFVHLGGAQADGRIYAGERETLQHYRDAIEKSGADMVFLALDAGRGREVRPYLGATPVYATSQIFPGARADPPNADLAGVRFVGMPWLLQPDHAAVMAYPRKDYGGNLDLQRLYALGIDAFRISQDLANGNTAIALDGVTGELVLGSDGHFRRGLPIAEMNGATAEVVGRTAP